MARVHTGPSARGRSSLKTWLFRILTNKAKTRGASRDAALPSFVGDGDEEDTVAVDVDCSNRAAWRSALPRGVPEERLAGRGAPGDRGGDRGAPETSGR